MPLAMDTYGRMHTDYHKFLDRIADSAVAFELVNVEERPAYRRQLLIETSVCLQRGNARIFTAFARDSERARPTGSSRPRALSMARPQSPRAPPSGHTHPDRRALILSPPPSVPQPQPPATGTPTVSSRSRHPDRRVSTRSAPPAIAQVQSLGALPSGSIHPDRIARMLFASPPVSVSSVDTADPPPPPPLCPQAPSPCASPPETPPSPSHVHSPSSALPFCLSARATPFLPSSQVPALVRFLCLDTPITPPSEVELTALRVTPSRAYGSMATGALAPAASWFGSPNGNGPRTILDAAFRACDDDDSDV